MKAGRLVGCVVVGACVVSVIGALAAEPPPSAAKLVQAWSLAGQWQAVACDKNTGAIYAVAMSGACIQVDRAGKSQPQIQLAQGGTVARLARLPGTAGVALLVFTPWQSPLNAYDTSGKQLWSYPQGEGIDDVWTYDLNGDGADEVIIGYNGSTGLHVLDSGGKLLWKHIGIGNVWHVCAGEVLGAGKPGVVATSATGKVLVLGPDGTKPTTLGAPFYANMVRVGQPSDSKSTAAIFVGGMGPFAAMTSEGAPIWSLTLPGASRPTADSADVASGRPWLAVGMRGGLVHVVDADKGQIIASVNGQGNTPQVCWDAPEGKDAPLLIVATGNALTAFRVEL